MVDPHIAEAQQRAARQIDEETAKIDLRSALDQVWPLLFFPLELEQGAAAEERLRLLLRPEGLRVAELTGDASALRLDVAVRGRFLVTSRFASSPPTALPPPGEVPAGPFLLHLEKVQPLEPLIASLREAWVGRSVATDVGTVRVTRVEGRVTAAGVAVGLAVEGGLQGTLWAVALPVHEGGALQLQGARWTDATALALADEDLATVLGTELLAVLDQARWPIDDEGLRARTLRALRSFETPSGVTVAATLEASTAPGQVFGEGDTLVVRIPTPGSLVVSIDAATVAEGL